MQPWERRAYLGALKSALPFQDQLRRAVRLIRPYRTNPENDVGLLDTALQQVTAFTAAGLSLQDATVVEIGTGWLPIVPLIMLMAGAARVITVDQVRLMDSNTLLQAKEFIRLNLDAMLERKGFPNDLFDVARLKNAEQFIDYRAPFNFNVLPSDSADVIVSRTVLEHISEPGLETIFANSRRILRKGGLMCHLIDMSDHFEHTDKSISRLNFMRFEQPAWDRLTRDPQFYQNRLRRFEFIDMIRHSGFEILSCTGEPNQKALEDLKTTPVFSRYTHVSHAEMAILVSLIVARPLQDKGQSDQNSN
jgi:hypothetical protein